ncbi:MAG TPA: TOMM precursor leader peptide-binding protein [Thermoanaerobaculia bacterium]|jgi:ribosomal protein S12 methylthiotransferase accessory factor
MKKIRLSPSASITTTHSGVLLRSDLGTFQLQGEDVRLFVTSIVPLLDGTRDAAAVAAALPGYSAESVTNFLTLLQYKGLVEPVPESDRRLAEERFFQKWGLGEGAALSRLADARVAVAGLEPWGANAAIELGVAGIRHLQLLDNATVSADDILGVRAFTADDRGRLRRDAVRDAIVRLADDAEVTAGPIAIGEGERFTLDGSFELIVIGLDRDDVYLLRRIAAYAHEQRVRTIHGHLDGFEAWIGPAVVPGDTACWNCFRLRRLGAADHVQSALELDASLSAAPGASRARAFLAPMAGLAGQALAMHAIKLLVPYSDSRLPGRFLVQNLVTGDSALHKVLRMPWCDVCGGAAGQQPKDDAKPRNLSTANDVEELKNALEGIVDRRVGIIKILSSDSIGGLPPQELPIAATALVSAYTDGTQRHLHATDPQIGSGKGLNKVDALIGAAGEAIERYSAARYRKSDLHVSPTASMEGEFVDPRRLCLYSEEQYAQPGFPYARFDANRPIHWTRGWWFGTGEPVWVPALPAYFNFEACSHEYFCQVSSNGLAAGADVEDAAMRALFELIERDAFMLTWLCQLPARRILVDDSVEPAVREVIRQLNHRGAEVELYLLDGTDLDVPTVMCLALGDGQTLPAASVALACHLDPRVAVRKAVLEQGHVGPYLTRKLTEHAVPATPADVHTLEDHAAYYFTPERLPVFDFIRRSDRPPIAARDLPAVDEVSVAACAARLEKAGVRVAVVDVTSPDLRESPFRVARAIGLDVQPIHFGERFRRLVSPRLEKHSGGRPLNPHPHPLA